MLKGQTIDLRLIREEELDEYHAFDSDVYSRGPYFPMELRSLPTLKARYAKDGMWGDEFGSLVIVDKEDGRMLGFICHFKIVHYYHALEIGYILFRPEDRGKGIMTEALCLYSDYLFDCKPISRLQVQMDPANIASRRTAEKAGYKLEGTARHAFIRRGEPCDLLVLSLVRGEDGEE